MIVRVGGATITRSALQHQMAVMATGRAVASVKRQDPELQRQALEALIVSRWTIGEAAERGLAPSEEETKRRLQAKEAAEFPGGEAELRTFLKAAGQTPADLQLEAQLEAATSRLQSLALKSTPAVTEAQARRYYATHMRRYAVPLRRQIRITNRKTTAAAERVKREVAAGKAFLALSTPEMVVLPSRPGETYARPTLDRAIARAKLDALMGPVKQRVDYFIFEVKRVLPATYESFAQVQGAITRRLTHEARRRTLSAFVEAWRSRWRARTDCSSGYIVQRCRQYDGPRAPEDPVAFK